MTKFIPKDKLSKKARKELNTQGRTTWAFSPAMRRVESKKVYDRKKHSRAWKNGDGDAFLIHRKLRRNRFLLFGGRGSKDKGVP